MATFTFEEQHVIIRFLHLRGMKPIEIHRQLSETCSDGITDVKNVQSWVWQFKEGHVMWCVQVLRSFGSPNGIAHELTFKKLPSVRTWKPILLSGSKRWALTNSDKHRLQISGRKILRKIYGPLSDNGIWRGCTNSRHQVAQATKLCAVMPNIYESSVWNLLHVTLMAPRIQKWVPNLNLYIPSIQCIRCKQELCMLYKKPYHKTGKSLNIKVDGTAI